MTDDAIMSIDTWDTNGRLIADAAKLGYIYGRVLDMTYGMGVFWHAWQPDHLIGIDIDPDKNHSFKGESMDFTDLPLSDESFDTVVFDPPYKLNGRPSPEEERYGVHELTRWQDRMQLIRDGVLEGARLTVDMFVIKCQDQVCSGKMVWQTDFITNILVEELEMFRKVDRFDYLSYRPQPTSRSQKHARHNASQLLVFKRT